MQDLIITFLQEVNVLQLAAVGLMFWFFYTRLEKKIDKLDEKLSGKIEKVEENLSGKIDKVDSRVDKLDYRIDRLNEKVDGLDRRLCRLEGTLQYHGHCFFHQEQDKKAE